MLGVWGEGEGQGRGLLGVWLRFWTLGVLAAPCSAELTMLTADNRRQTGDGSGDAHHPSKRRVTVLLQSDPQRTADISRLQLAAAGRRRRIGEGQDPPGSSR